MSLLTYDEARPWAESIRLELASGHMPPWFGDPGVAALKDPHKLSPRDLDVVLTWVTGGTPRGPALTDDARKASNARGTWRLGRPDCDAADAGGVQPARRTGRRHAGVRPRDGARPRSVHHGRRPPARQPRDRARRDHLRPRRGPHTRDRAGHVAARVHAGAHRRRRWLPVADRGTTGRADPLPEDMEAREQGGVRSEHGRAVPVERAGSRGAPPGPDRGRSRSRRRRAGARRRRAAKSWRAR